MRHLIRICIVGTLALLPAAALAQGRTSPEAVKATLHYQSGWELMRAELWEKAATEFQQAIDIDKKFALAYYSLGRALVNQKKFAAAIFSYVKCRDIYLARAGDNFSSQVDNNKALDDQIFEMNDYLTKVFKGSDNERRQMQEQLSRMKQARERGATVTADVQVPYFVSLALGSAYFRSERFADAEREFKATIDANPSAGEAHNNLAVVYMLTGRFDDSEREIKAAEAGGFRVNPQFKEDLKKARTKR